jgi:hypothetical protein
MRSDGGLLFLSAICVGVDSLEIERTALLGIFRALLSKLICANIDAQNSWLYP